MIVYRSHTWHAHCRAFGVVSLNAGIHKSGKGHDRARNRDDNIGLSKIRSLAQLRFDLPLGFIV
jgi:hypothetical protein